MFSRRFKNRRLQSVKQFLRVEILISSVVRGDSAYVSSAATLIELFYDFLAQLVPQFFECAHVRFLAVIRVLRAHPCLLHFSSVTLFINRCVGLEGEYIVVRDPSKEIL